MLPFERFIPGTNEMLISLISPALGVVKENRGPYLNEPTGEDMKMGTAYGDGMPSIAPAAALVDITRSVLFSETPIEGR